MGRAGHGGGVAMKSSALNVYVCPVCKDALELCATLWQGSEVLGGSLVCRACSRDYPIVRGVPRFVNLGSYASSFGKQWNWFRTVQLDSCNGTDRSRLTLQETTGWSADDFNG